MKKNLQLFILLCSVIMWQSCGSKNEISNDENIDSVSDASIDILADSMQREDITAKRAMIEKARTEKQEQRMLAVAEKAKLSLTYKDTSGQVVYNKAEIDPSFRGGNKAMMTYLRDNLQYPKAAENKGELCLSTSL